MAFVHAVNEPVVDAGPDATADEGSAWKSFGSFTDPDSSSWSATVDYGDGSTSRALPFFPTKEGHSFTLD